MKMNKFLKNYKIEMWNCKNLKKSRNRDWITITYRKLKTSQKLKRKQRIKKTPKKSGENIRFPKK